MGVWALEDLHIPMARQSKSFKVLVAEAMRRAAEDGMAAAIDATPVDTGHLANNWHFSVGSPSGAVRGSYEYLRGSQGARPGRVKLGSYKGGDIYINNNVRYAGYVNDGSPTVRPHNMKEKAVQAIHARLQSMTIIKQV